MDNTAPPGAYYLTTLTFDLPAFEKLHQLLVSGFGRKMAAWVNANVNRRGPLENRDAVGTPACRAAVVPREPFREVLNGNWGHKFVFRSCKKDRGLFGRTFQRQNRSTAQGAECGKLFT